VAVKDESKVKTRHAEKLAELRESHATNGGEARREVGLGLARTASGSVQGAHGTSPEINLGVAIGNRRTTEESRIGRGFDSGARPFDTESFDSVESLHLGNGENGNAGRREQVASPSPAELPATLTAEQEADRQRELARIRQQNKRDRDRAEANGSTNGTNGATPPTKPEPAFNLKGLLGRTADTAVEKVKLLTKQEAEDAEEKLIELYQRGSALLDDLLEIIVRDHEPVTIWALTDEEAKTLASMHLERAKIDIGAARSVRKLLEIYDRIYMYMLFGPKVIATGKHINEHKGLSFR
jgi:DNA-binding TFAR19-related protein (PDSD5 family)